MIILYTQSNMEMKCNYFAIRSNKQFLRLHLGAKDQANLKADCQKTMFCIALVWFRIPRGGATDFSRLVKQKRKDKTRRGRRRRKAGRSYLI